MPTGQKKEINLKSKLDRIFSEYIRLRDSDSNGYIRCISCGKIVHWKESDAGHFVNRAVMSLRYDEKNVNAQCRYCNRFREGQMIGYTQGLIRKYGKDIITHLDIKRHNTCKMGSFEYEQLIKIYQQQIKQLKTSSHETHT